MSRPEMLRAELDVVATLVNDLMEYKGHAKNPLAKRACSTWIRKLSHRYDRLGVRFLDSQKR